MTQSHRKKMSKRNFTDADLDGLRRRFDALINEKYMPVILAEVDRRVQEILTGFYERAQEANANENNSP